MFLKVAADGTVSLEDRENFRAFKVVVEGGPARLDQVRRALSGIAEAQDQGHAWIFEQALRKRPEVANDAAWQSNLGAMIEKARPHGWVDDAKQAIRAHIEWTQN